MPPAPTRDVHVLITGYGPFLETKNNPSYLASKVLNGTTLKLPEHNAVIHFTVFEVEVSYDAVLGIVLGLHKRPPVLPETPVVLAPPPPGGYDIVLHIGQGLEGHIALETLAHKTSYDHPDVLDKFAPVVDGSTVPPTRGPGKEYETFSEELKTDIDVQSLVRYLNQTDPNVQVSYDPGRYLCDFIYYVSQAESHRDTSDSYKRSKVLFMHVPPAGVPHLISEMTETIRKATSWISQNHILNA